MFPCLIWAVSTNHPLDITLPLTVQLMHQTKQQLHTLSLGWNLTSKRLSLLYFVWPRIKWMDEDFHYDLWMLKTKGTLEEDRILFVQKIVKKWILFFFFFFYSMKCQCNGMYCKYKKANIFLAIAYLVSKIDWILQRRLIVCIIVISIKIMFK